MCRQVVCGQGVCGQVVCRQLCVDKLCDNLHVDKVCVDKLCVDKSERRRGGGAEPKTRTPHKDVGKNVPNHQPVYINE